MAFDPDAYLAESSTTTAFDPDAFLAQNNAAFDPDSYLSEQEGEKQPGLVDNLIDYFKSDEQKGRELMNGVDEILAKEYPDAGITPSEAKDSDILTLGDVAKKVGTEAGPTAVRVGTTLGAVALIAMTDGIATPVAMSMLASAGILGDRAARQMEGAPPATFMEDVETGAFSSLIAPLKVPAGVTKALLAGGLEGAAIGSHANKDGNPFSKEGGVAAFLDAGFRAVESKLLKTRLNKSQIGAKSSRLDFQAADELHFQSGINEVVDTRGVYTQIDDIFAQGKRNKDFLKAKGSELEQVLRGKQLAGPENIIFENASTARLTSLDVKGMTAAKERAKIAVTGQPFVATVYRGDSGAATASFADPFYTTDKGVAGTYAVQKKHTMLDNEIKQIVGDSPSGDVVAAAKLHFNDRNDGKIYSHAMLFPDQIAGVRAMVASNPALKEKGRLYAEALEKQWKLSSLDPLKESVAESKITLKNPLVIDYEGRLFSEMLVDGEWMLPSRRGDAIGTIQEWQNSIIAKAKAEGHDGVVFANVRDSGYGLALDQAVKPGNVVVSFNNTAVKSPVPVSASEKATARTQVAAKERGQIAAFVESSPSAQAEVIAKKSLEQTAELSPQAARMMAEHGGIDPRVMAPIARAAIGSALGIAQGDTPEEKLGYGLSYALTGAVASPALARKMGGALAKNTKLGRNWLPEVTLRPYMEALRDSTRNRDALLLDSNVGLSRIVKALNTFKNPVQREEANTMLYEYLHGGRAIETLPKVLRDAADTARVAVDDLSSIAIETGMVTGKTKETMLDNMGRYMRRSYKVFLEDGWKPEQKVIDRWITAQVDEAMLTKRSVLGRKALEEEYTKTALNMVTRDAAEQFIVTGKSVGAGIFKHRKDLDQLTRELLGEVRDPVALLKDTVPRIAKNISNYEMQKSIVATGEKLGQMTRTPTADPKKWVQIASEDTPYNAFAGVYTSPEIKEAWESMTKTQTHGVLQGIATVSSVAKMSKTLGSPKGYSSNAWNALFDTVSQGHFAQLLNPKNWKSAAYNAGNILGFIKPSGQLDRNVGYQFYKKMVREGLVNRSISANDFLYALDHGISVRGSASAAAHATVEKLGKLYMTPETAGKVFSMAGEMKTLKAASLGKTDDELFKIAAAKVRATSADFDYIPRIAKQLSTYGGLNPFVSYQIDRFRVVYNTYAIGMKEITSGNPALRKMGAKRIASMTAVLGGVSYYAANDHLTPEQNEAMRRRMPPWDKNGFNRISELGEDGSFSYTNLNYIVGQSSAIEAANAAMRGDSPEESAKLAVRTLWDQLSGAPILYRPTVAAAQGRTETGQPIRSPSDSGLKPAWDTGFYLANESFAPLAIKEFDKLMSAETDADRRDILMSNFAGIRLRRQNLNDSFRNSAANLMRNHSIDQRLYGDDKRNDESPAGQQAAYATFEKRRRVLHDELSQIVADMPTLNIPKEEAIKVLLEAHTPSRLIAGAIDGIYLPTQPGERKTPSDYLEQWQVDGVTTQAETLKLIRAITKQDAPLGRRIALAYRDQVVDEKRGITQEDKLISGFSTTDGSRVEYLTQKFIKIRDERGQAMASGWIQGLRKKGFVPPAVYAATQGLVARQGQQQQKAQ
jgi:hypothetical protein